MCGYNVAPSSFKALIKDMSNNICQVQLTSGRNYAKFGFRNN